MATSTETSTVKVSDIEVPEGFNPRREFDETALEQLAASIKKNGITTALTVARENGHFVLIDGERRLRAAKKAGVKEVPVLVRDDENALAAALVANVQREDLNPIEEAEALERLSEVEGLGTHKALAEQVGKPVPFVSKRLRLLALPEGCHAGIANGEIPLAAEPQLRAIAKASPEVAVAATELALSDDVEASDLVDHPGNILRMLCVREGAPFIRDVSNGVTIRDLVGDEEKASELEIRLEQTVENRNSHYADYLRFVLEEADVDRLRASGKLIEFPSDWEFGSDQLYLVTPSWPPTWRPRRSSAPSARPRRPPSRRQRRPGWRSTARPRRAISSARPSEPSVARSARRESARPRGPRPSTPSSARPW